MKKKNLHPKNKLELFFCFDLKKKVPRFWYFIFEKRALQFFKYLKFYFTIEKKLKMCRNKKMSKYLTRIFEEASNTSRSKRVSPTKNDPIDYRNSAISPSNLQPKNKYDSTSNQTIVRPVPIKFDNGYNTSHPIR